MIFVCTFSAVAGPIISTSDDSETFIVNDAPDQEVFVIGKSVVVNKSAKGVLAVGGDVVVEGRVEGDVATIGGNVIQKEKAYIGGDVIVFGGSYKPEAQEPLRQPGKQTVMLGVFEDELRQLGQNPSEILSPTFSIAFLAQRLLLALLWFVISLGLVTVAPGAFSRAVARINLSTLKICGLGAVVLLIALGSLVGGALVLPNYLGATFAFMGGIVLLLGYIYGRVTLQIALGKLVQKHFLSEHNRSETLAIVIGVALTTAVLSLPYVWLLGLFTIFIVGIGLIATARANQSWQNP